VATDHANDADSVAVLAARVVVELTHSRIERIANRNVDVGVRGIVGPFARDYQLLARNMDVDTYVKTTAVDVVSVWRFNNHSATRDSASITLELLLSFLPDSGLNGVRLLHVFVRDLERYLHALLLERSSRNHNASHV
jgi:hypothetical protein